MRFLIDFKTSKGCKFYPEMGYQAAAYAHPLGITTSIVVLLDKESEKFATETIVESRLRNYFEVFKGLYHAYLAILDENGTAESKLQKRYDRAVKAGKDPHIYEHPEHGFVPSVTTILGLKEKPALLNWAAGCAADYIKDADERYGLYDKPDSYKEKVYIGAKKAFYRVKKKASTIGTDTHEAIEKYLLGEDFAQVNAFLATKDQRARIAYNNFVDWWECNNFKVESIEQQVYGCEPGYDKYGGRYDVIVTS